MSKNSKRILSLTIRRMPDECPDTSYLGNYANQPTSEYSIDRAHSQDCASVREDIRKAKTTLEHVQQTIGDLHILAQYNGALANAKLDVEREPMDEAYDEVGELIEAIDECDCDERGDMQRGEYRYFNPSFNYVDKSGKALPGNTPEEVRKYVRQDYERMESLNRGDWSYIGIRVDAQVTLSTGVVQDITSGGLWGIESDSESSYFDEVAADEWSQLKEELSSMGFSKRALATAWKERKEKDE